MSKSLSLHHESEQVLSRIRRATHGLSQPVTS